MTEITYDLIEQDNGYSRFTILTSRSNKDLWPYLMILNQYKAEMEELIGCGPSFNSRPTPITTPDECPWGHIGNIFYFGDKAWAVHAALNFDRIREQCTTTSS